MSSIKVLKPVMRIILIIIISRANGQAVPDPKNEKCPDQVPQFCICKGLQISCDCNNEIAELGPAFGDQTVISMKNCKQLTIHPQSFIKSGPLQIVLQNITDLQLMKGSFEKEALRDARINITIINATTNELPSDTFIIKENSLPSVDAVNQSWTTKPTLIFQIVNSVIHKIATGAFGKFVLQRFSIVNSTLRQISERAINNHVTKKFHIINTTIIEIHKNAFILHNSSVNETLTIAYNTFKGAIPVFLLGNIRGDVFISNNTFPKLEQSPWNLRVQGDVILRGNVFTNIPKHGLHFRIKHRISIVHNTIINLQSYALQWVMPEGRKTFLYLDGNVIHKHEPMSLQLNGSFKENSVVIKHILFKQKCLCNITYDIAAALGLANLTIEKLYENEVHQQWFLNGECLPQARGTSRITIDHFLYNKCLTKKSLTMILILVLSIILITIAIGIIIAWRKMKRKTTNSSSASDYQSFTEPIPPSRAPSSWAIVQPEPRTYQQTEIHILFDKAHEIDDCDGKSLPDLENREPNNSKGSENTKEKDTLQMKTLANTRMSCPALPAANTKS